MGTLPAVAPPFIQVAPQHPPVKIKRTLKLGFILIPQFSATAFEDKSQQPTTILGGHLIQSATEPTFQQNDEDKNKLLDQQQRSKSQPPAEISMAIEKQKKGNGKKLVNRL